MYSTYVNPENAGKGIWALGINQYEQQIQQSIREKLEQTVRFEQQKYKAQFR